MAVSTPIVGTTIATAALLLGLAVPSHATSFLRSGQVNKGDADMVLAYEFNQDHADRLERFEDALRSTYTALPKNEHGHLGHQAVRYVLHRLFVQRHGWYIKGLDPKSDSPGNASVKEWVPSYLQAHLEERAGEHGASLRELAILAAALEDLVRKEALGRLTTAYEVHQLPVEGSIDGEEAEDVMRTYFISFLLANNLSAASPVEMHNKQKIFAKKYKGWDEAQDWFRHNIMEKNGTTSGTGFAMATTSRMAFDIGEQYHTFNDLECKNLKSTLLEIEDRKAGRVHLSAFYAKSLYSHWQFTEKADYLRTIGALDESNATKPLVIVPNYVMGRMNCLEVSNIYSLCCRNECEDLMGNLERQIGAPEADPDRIAALVAALPSDTMAPRMLSDSLKSRLLQVAAGNGGRVPLHSRLFAQWMHHAYPRECPYPHELGTTSPQTPDEWIKETGHESTSASEEEMKKQVESCPADIGQQEGSSELPWSEAEEHFASQPRLAQPTLAFELVPAQAEPARLSGPVMVLRGQGIAVLVSVASAAALALRFWRKSQVHQCHPSNMRGLLDGELEGGAVFPVWLNDRCHQAYALCSLSSMLYAVELLDQLAFTVALVGGFGVLALQAASNQSHVLKGGSKQCTF